MEKALRNNLDEVNNFLRLFLSALCRKWYPNKMGDETEEVGKRDSGKFSFFYPRKGKKLFLIDVRIGFFTRG